MTDYKQEDLIDSTINFKQASVDFATEAELFSDNKTVLETANARLAQLKTEATTALTHLIETEKKKAIDDYILVTLGWMTANQENLAVHEIIATLERQSEELQGEVE